MRFVSWKKVKSWHCIACGECCKKFNVPLKPSEYVKISRLFNGKVFNFNVKPGRVYIRRKNNKKCIFQYKKFARWLCRIQNIKPIACKIFPFLISKSKNKEALYKYKGVSYNVYLDTTCISIELGEPSINFIYKTIPKALELSLDPYSPLNLLTSNLLRELNVSEDYF